MTKPRFNTRDALSIVTIVCLLLVVIGLYVEVNRTRSTPAARGHSISSSIRAKAQADAARAAKRLDNGVTKE